MLKFKMPYIKWNKEHRFRGVRPDKSKARKSELYQRKKWDSWQVIPHKKVKFAPQQKGKHRFKITQFGVNWPHKIFLILYRSETEGLLSVLIRRRGNFNNTLFTLMFSRVKWVIVPRGWYNSLIRFSDWMKRSVCGVTSPIGYQPAEAKALSRSVLPACTTQSKAWHITACCITLYTNI